MVAGKIQLIVFAKVYTRKERHYQILTTYVVEDGGLAIIGTLYLGKQVYLVVGLPEIILNIYIDCLVAELLKLILKRATLFKEAPYFARYLHINLSSCVCGSPIILSRQHTRML
jgi:hypothetical protein